MKKLPVCALCGLSLLRSDRTLLQWEALKSKPMVGWHFVCSKADSLYQNHTHGRANPGYLITKIAARGKNRVS